MSDLEFLLTKEYQEFTAAIRTVFADKGALEAEFKKQFDAYKKQKAELENSVQELHTNWENWKSKQVGEGNKGEE